MPPDDRPLTIRQIADLFGLSQEFVRAAAYRKTGNVLPKVNLKTKADGRNYYRIRPSRFREWLEREEQEVQ